MYSWGVCPPLQTRHPGRSSGRCTAQKRAAAGSQCGGRRPLALAAYSRPGGNVTWCGGLALSAQGASRPHTLSSLWIVMQRPPRGRRRSAGSTPDEAGAGQWQHWVRNWGAAGANQRRAIRSGLIDRRQSELLPCFRVPAVACALPAPPEKSGPQIVSGLRLAAQQSPSTAGVRRIRGTGNRPALIGPGVPLAVGPPRRHARRRVRSRGCGRRRPLESTSSRDLQTAAPPPLPPKPLTRRFPWLEPRSVACLAEPQLSAAALVRSSAARVRPSEFWSPPPGHPRPASSHLGTTSPSNQPRCRLSASLGATLQTLGARTSGLQGSRGRPSSLGKLSRSFKLPRRAASSAGESPGRPRLDDSALLLAATCGPPRCDHCIRRRGSQAAGLLVSVSCPPQSSAPLSKFKVAALHRPSPHRERGPSLSSCPFPCTSLPDGRHQIWSSFLGPRAELRASRSAGFLLPLLTPALAIFSPRPPRSLLQLTTHRPRPGSQSTVSCKPAPVPPSGRV